MKKSLVALAALAVVGAASAQSSVTLFGVVDATWAYGSGSVSNKTQLTNSGYNSSRLGFRGVEDIGGGMWAGFWLEAGLANDDGQGAATNSNNQATGTGAAVNGRQGLTFNRRSTVSVGGKDWGSIRLGRDYTQQFWNLTVFDPFGTNGVGTTQQLNSSLGGPVTVRASNLIAYHYNSENPSGNTGIYGAVQYYLGENNAAGLATDKDGRGAAFRLGYAQGPFNVAVASSSTKYATGNIRSTNIGGEYNFGAFVLDGIYSQDRVASTPSVKGRGYLLGGLIPVGVGQIRLAYSTYKTDVAGTPKSNKYALGYVHNLSKRTALYGTYARVSNSGGAAQSLNGAVTGVNSSSRGYDIGVRHSF